MNEAYLQYIWKHRIFQHKDNYVLSDGKMLRLLHQGFHNISEQGPDFKNASIQIETIKWYGNIEVHVNSSDWIKHNHSEDDKYSNVILHVVFNHDRDIYINNELIPTLEMKELILNEHFEKFNQLNTSKNWIPCEKLILNIEPIVIHQQIENALINRLSRKSILLQEMYVELNGDLLQMKYQLLAMAFGTKYNAHNFLLLSNFLPIKVLQKLDRSFIKSLFLKVAGFDDSESLELDFLIKKYNINTLEKSIWNYKGLRVAGFPENRIEQFVKIILDMDLQLDFEKMRNKNESKEIITAKFNDNILINSLCLYLWWYGEHVKDFEYKDAALDLLMQIEAEENTIIKKWKALNISVKNAFDSQGLLELKNEFCNFRKCLQCKIAFKILKA